MSFSSTFSALCIKFNASTWLILYIYFITCAQKCSYNLKIDKATCVEQNISAMNVPDTIFTKIKWYYIIFYVSANWYLKLLFIRCVLFNIIFYACPSWHLIFIDYYMTFFISHVISARNVRWVEGWYGMWYENCHIITYLSYTSMRLSSYLWELILIQLHFLYNNTRWFNLWFINKGNNKITELRTILTKGKSELISM